MCSLELTQRIWPNQDCVPSVDHPWHGLEVCGSKTFTFLLTAFHDTGYNSTDERHREGIVDMEFEGSFLIVMTMMRENIEECPYVIKTFASDIGHLENGAYSLTDELRRCLNGLLTRLDEDWDLPCPWGFEDARKLRDSLLQDLWRANIDFGDNNHDRHLQCERNPEVLSDYISVCTSREMIG